MDQFIESVVEQIQAHWVKFLTAAAFMVLGWLLGKRRARKEWRRKEFFDRVNFSLNMFRDGTLLIRTLMEKRGEEVFLNSVATETVIEAAHHTTAQDPTLSLPESDYWYYLNAILNEVAEKFAHGQIQRDAGAEVTSCMYTLCLTCESAGAMKTRKVRAMMIQKSLLRNLPEEAPKFEQPHHSTRWDTLKQLAAIQKTAPHKFMDVEICV
jgi:hypothetical protein